MSAPLCLTTFSASIELPSDFDIFTPCVFTMPACSQCLRQPNMADELGSVSDEGGVAEHMVGMAMGVDDVADRLGCASPHRRQQRLALTEAAAGVDHGHRILADDKADIGDVAFVLAGHEGGGPGVHEDSRCDFAHRQFGCPGAC